VVVEIWMKHWQFTFNVNVWPSMKIFIGVVGAMIMQKNVVFTEFTNNRIVQGHFSFFISVNLRVIIPYLVWKLQMVVKPFPKSVGTIEQRMKISTQK
jgi:hypothetical protein